MTAVQHSSYWLDRDIFDDEDEGSDILKIARLASVRRAVANFVSILSGENIPVHFSSGQQSYTDGKMVVIAADDDPKRFDVMVGLALHEGSHVLLTDFRWLQQLQKVRQDVGHGYEPAIWSAQRVQAPYLRLDVLKTLFPSAIHGCFPPHPDTAVWGEDTAAYMQAKKQWSNTIIQAFDDLQVLMNILEDRRIDKYVYTRAGGYRPYYRALYDRYFFTAEVGKNLRFNPKWRELTVENYINRLLFSFHPAADPKAMPGLEQLISLMDIQNIDRIAPSNDLQQDGSPAWEHGLTYANTPVIWQEACKLYSYILKFVKIANRNEPETDTSAMGQAAEGNSHLDGLPNLDGMPGDDEMTATEVEQDNKGKPGKFNEKKGGKEVAEARKVATGDVKKKKLSKQEQAQVSALEAAEAKMVDLKGEGIPGGKCMVTRKINDQLMDQEWFIFKRWNWKDNRTHEYVEKSIAAGKRMGAILVHRLQVRNDPLVTKQTRLQHGGLDRRLLAQLGMDITSVFQKSREDIHKPAMLHLTIDASGSMSGRKWEKVRTIAVALAYMGSKMRNVDVVISIRGGQDMPIVAVVYDSRRDQFQHFVRYIRFLEPNGGTPEGLCFKATMELITECAKTHDVYFINFSDGEPAFVVSDKSNLVGRARRRQYSSHLVYLGETAWKHTRAMVQQMREVGVKVLSYFIVDRPLGSTNYSGTHQSWDAFRKMYGEDAVNVNVENAGEVLRTLNKLLTIRGV